MEIILDGHIEKSNEIRGGKPRLANTRITVADIAIMHLRLGQSLEEIAGRYELPLSGVYAAMTYYYDHRGEIDQTIAQDQAFIGAFKLNNPSPLQSKLKSLNRA